MLWNYVIVFECRIAEYALYVNGGDWLGGALVQSNFQAKLNCKQHISTSLWHSSWISTYLYSSCNFIMNFNYECLNNSYMCVMKFKLLWEYDNFSSELHDLWLFLVYCINSGSCRVVSGRVCSCRVGHESKVSCHFGSCRVTRNIIESCSG